MSGPQPPGRPRKHGYRPGDHTPPARRDPGRSRSRGSHSASADENPTETLWLGDSADAVSGADSHTGDLFEDDHADTGSTVDDGDAWEAEEQHASGAAYVAGDDFDDRYYDDEYSTVGEYEYYDDEYYDGEYHHGEYYEGEYHDDERAEPVYYDDERAEPSRPQRRRGKRALGWVIALVVLVALIAGAYYGARHLLGFGFGYDDYDGAGKEDTVVRVSDGDTTGQIAQTLADADVVASADAFITASEDNSKVRGVQPGYYEMKTKASGEDAARRIVSDDAHVGNFEIEPGLQFEDVTMPDDSTTDGVLRRLSDASCADIDGKDTCVSVDKLVNTIEDTDLSELGVPEWARDDADDGKGLRKLEGLVAPGGYDVRPGSSAEELLQQVMDTSSSRLQAAGLPDSSEDLDPYQVLVTASVIQREGVTDDFDKISRVIQNRLSEGMQLRMDSTINYVNETPTVRTTDKQRSKEGAYNTYLNEGLPPTPISAPGQDAIDAALHPAEGDWKYFVKCDSDGGSCFTSSYKEHQEEVGKAQDRGVY